MTIRSLLALALLTALTTLGAAPVAAQGAAGEGETLTLREAVALALDRSPDVRVATATVAVQRQDVAAARAARLPTLSLSAGPVQRYGLAFDQTTGSLQQSTANAFSASAYAAMTLVGGPSTRSELARRRYLLDAERSELSAEQAEAARAAATAYLQAVLSAEDVAIRTEALDAERRRLEILRDAVAIGSQPPAEATVQESIVGKAELALLDAVAALERARTTLFDLLRLPPTAAFALDAPEVEATDAEALDDLVRRALANRPALQAQRARASASESARGSAWESARPRVDLYATLGTSYTSLAQQQVGGFSQTIPLQTETGEAVFAGGVPATITEITPGDIQRVSFSDQFFGDNVGGSLGLAITVPVFDRAEARARSARAQLAVEREQRRLDALEHAIAQEVHAAHLAVRHARARLPVVERQAELAAEALAAEEARYDFGTSTLTDLTIARTSVVEARRLLAQARATVTLRVLELHAALGDLDATLAPRSLPSPDLPLR